MSRGPEKQFDPDVALSKAMEVFWARGYEAASLSELLERMGIGKKSLYDTFGNKRSLFLKALDRYAHTEVKSIRDQLLAPGSPLANLERVLKNLQQRHSLPGSQGCMLGTNIADFGTDETEIASNSSIDSRSIARMLLCTTQGMALLGRVVDDEMFLHGTVEATVMLLKNV